jgi:hypothetical protein
MRVNNSVKKNLGRFYDDSPEKDHNFYGRQGHNSGSGTEKND